MINRQTTNVRASAARVVAGVIQSKGSLGSILSTFATHTAAIDQSLLQELCYGSLRQFFRLTALIKPLLRQPLRQADTDIQALLLIGAYQLLHTRIPVHAALHDTVDGCRALGKPWATGLVNGVLRNLQREQAMLETRAAVSDEFVTGHPAWLAHKIRHAWPAQAVEIFAVNNERPPMTLRVNLQKTTRADYLAQLQAEDIAATPGELSPAAIRLSEAVSVEKLPGFNEGRVSVQDEAAQLCANLLMLAPGQRVLDACCAPGGKSCHILETMPDLAELVLIDNDESRLLRVHENLARQQLSATIVCADASVDTAFIAMPLFDRILVDAPCSGTGVIRRHPDIRLLRRETDIIPLANTQLAILDNLWSRLVPGGILLYVTCSVLPQENERVISRFIAQHPNASRLPIDSQWGIALDSGRQLLPTINGADGFYFARVQKKS